MAGGQLIEGATRQTYFMVDPRRLKTFPEGHPNFDPRSRLKPDPAMVDNVMTLGVRSPIQVRVVKVPEHYVDASGNEQRLDAGEYVVDGHQRLGWALAAIDKLRASGEKDDLTVPVIGLKDRDDTWLSSISLALNQRVTEDPIGIANKLRSLVARLGGDVAKAAAQSGYTPSFVRHHLALLEASKQVQRAVAAGDISVTAAAQIAKKAPEEQAEIVEKAKELGAEREKAGGKDGRKKKTASTKDVTRAAKKVERSKAAKGDAAPTDTDKPDADDDAEPPTKRQIQAALKRAEETGAHGIARALRWVLTGEGDPLAE